MAVLLAIIVAPVVDIYTDNPEVLRYAKTYLHIVPDSYCLLGYFLIATTSLNILQKPCGPAAYRRYKCW